MNPAPLLVFCGMLAVAFSAIARYPANEGESFCVYERKQLEIGETFYPENQCLQVECIGDNGIAFETELRSCPPIPQTDIENVRIVERKHLQYPDCCPTIETDDIGFGTGNDL